MNGELIVFLWLCDKILLSKDDFLLTFMLLSFEMYPRMYT